MAQTQREWTQEQIEKYAAVFPLCSKLARALETILKKAAKKLAPLAIVQTRPKAIASYAEKIQRKHGKYTDPVAQLTDLCGARVITHTRDQVLAVCEFVKSHFEIDWDNSLDVSERLGPAEFGYRSVHYIVQLKPGVFPTKDVDVVVDEDLYPDRAAGRPMKAEIQVRTILEHAWADITHDLSYKSAFAIPQKWQREVARIAAMLEDVDGAFGRFQAGLQRYAADYGMYLPEGQARDEIAKLEVVLEHDRENAELAARIGRLAIAVEDWQKAVDVLGRFAESDHAPARRELGIGLCELHRGRPDSQEYRDGQAHLEFASAPAHHDPVAILALADTLGASDDERIRSLRRQAYEAAPTDPYPLGIYLEGEIAHQRDLSVVSLMAPVIRDALERCRDQADVGMNLPQAFYEMGKFHLLLREPHKALADYAKAIQLSGTETPIERALASLASLRSALDAPWPELEWARRLLVAARVVKLRELGQKLAGGAAQEAERIGKKAAAAERALQQLGTQGAEPIAGPVVIVAGGCDPAIEQEMQDYRDFLLEAFQDFKGTIISGGTTSGISGLVGEVQAACPRTIRTVSYLPRNLAEDAKPDERYRDLRRTDGDSFSPLEPIQSWIDLLASGIRPSDVRLVGINGGAIAAAEYRIALALGARVGLVQESGREAARIFPDRDWAESRNLLHLPRDPMTARMFVGSGAPKLPEHIRERIARGAHGEYRETQKTELHTRNPSMVDWDRLPEGLRESNRQQADHIFAKLSQIGCSVREVVGRPVALMTFTAEEIETLARMEHARWNVERLLDGWKWGGKKDVELKISPYLVGWDELPENVREWDRAASRIIPKLLAEVGLEVRRDD